MIKIVKVISEYFKIYIDNQPHLFSFKYFLKAFLIANILYPTKFW